MCTFRFQDLRWAALVLGLAGCGAETDPERIAAGWVLDNGGQVAIESGGQTIEIATGGSLPGGPCLVRWIAWDIYPGDRNPRVGDADLARLSALRGIESLDLWAADLSDAGMAHLAGLATLKRLNLSDTGLSDSGLEQLHGLTNLRELSVLGTRVSDQGVAAFKRAVPGCTIRR